VKKPLIEHENLDLDRLIREIGREGRKEKNAKNPLNDLFYWWTRKPLILSRSSIMLSLLEDQKDVSQFLKLNLEKRSHTYAVDISKVKKINPKLDTIKILDPFAGAGNLIFEPSRMKLNTHASDYNPLAYLILKGILEYPQKYSTLVNDVKKYGTELIEISKLELSNYFDDENLAFIWLWCIQCNHCGQKIPLTNSMWISRKQKLGFKINLDDKLDSKFEIIENISEHDASKYTQKGGKAICIKCNNSIDYKTITNDIKNNDQRKLVFLKTKSGFRLSNKKDLELFDNAKSNLEENWQELLNLGYIPQEEIKPDPRSGLKNYGITLWHQYFSSRQLLVFSTLIKNIKKISQQIPDKEYQKVITTYLSFILGKHLDANSLGVHWHTGSENPEYTLSFRRTNFVFNHAEPNPFAKVRGNLYSILDDVVNSIKFCQESGAKSQVYLQSAFDLSKFSDFDIIFADPPNPNDIQFAEQSEFFYVWISKILCEYYPELPKKVSLDEDISDSPGRFGDRKTSLSFYKKGLKKTMVEINNSLKDDGIVLFYFSPTHKKSWNLLVDVLRDSKFKVTNLHSIHFENITNVMPHLGVDDLGTILISCRKQISDESAYYEDLINEIENQTKNRLEKFNLNELTKIPIGDLFFISFNKILQTITKYSDIKSFEKEKEIDLNLLIEQVQKITILYLFHRISDKSIGVLGNQISTYIFLKVFYKKFSSDELEKITKGFGIKKSSLEINNMIVKDNDVYRISRLDEFKIEEKPSEISYENLYEQICFCYQNINKIKSKNLSLDRLDNFKKVELLEITKILIQLKSVLGEFDEEMQKLNGLLEFI
jgi:putative DNA methylase